MPRPAGVFYDKRAGCWTTSALGEIRHTKSGKPYRAKVHNRDLAHPTKDRRAAEAWLADALRAEANQLRPVGEPILDHLYEWYMEAAEKTLTPETYARRREQLERALDWPGKDHPQRLGRLRVRDFSRADVRPFIEAMFAAGNSEAYVVKGLLMALKRLFSWACEIDPGVHPGLPLPSSPLARFSVASVPRRARRDVSAAHLRSVLRFMWRRALADDGLTRRFAQITTILVMTIRDTGARPKEICAAEWSELAEHPGGWGVITLPPWKWKNGRKTGQPRMIAIPPRIMRRIKWIRGLDGRHESFIFTHRRGRGRGAIGTAKAGEPWVEVDPVKRTVGDTKALQKYHLRVVVEMRAAKIDLPEGFRLYWNRSAYSTEARRRGADPTKLADSMGTSVRMLDTSYTDFDASDVIDAAKRAMGGESPGSSSP